VHLNYYFIRQISSSLSIILPGRTLLESYTQQKNEVIFCFTKSPFPYKEDPLFIRAYFSASFSCISFPDGHQRRKKNSTNLFAELEGLEVIAVYQFENERAFVIELADGYKIVFKLYGNQSNVIVYQNEEYFSVLRNKLKQDANRQFSSFRKTLKPDLKKFELKPELKDQFPLLGKVVEKYLGEEGYQNMNFESKLRMIQETINLISNPKSYFLTEFDGIVHLSLVQVGEIKKKYEDPLDCVNDFFKTHISHKILSEKKVKILNELKRTKSKMRKYVSKASDSFDNLKSANTYQQIGDTLMANLNEIVPGSDSIKLNDFFTGEEIDIKLRSNLTPQKNAERYYRKSKNVSLEIDNLKANLRSKKDYEQKIDKFIEDIEKINDPKTLNIYLANNGLEKNQLEKKDPVPYKEKKIMGFRIWIGKSAKHNDLLLRDHSWKEDLWLHAKDVSGSHVLIKYQAGRPFPGRVIERAAELASYYSKRKNESVCPVIYTPRKFVRKRKGDPPGSVVVEKEKVIMVEPSN